MSQYILGLDIGGTKNAAIIGTADGRGPIPQTVPAKELSQLAANGDAQAATVLEKSARMVGRACAMLTDIFAMQTIVLGSLARYLGDEWVQIIRDEFLRQALAVNAANTVIAVSALGDKLQDLSAIAAVNNKMI